MQMKQIKQAKAKKSEKTGGSISEILNAIIESDIPESESDIIEMLGNMGIPENNIMTAILAKLAEKGMSGDLKAFELIVKIISGISENKESAQYIYKGIPGYLLGKAYVDIYRDIKERKHRFYDFKGGRGSLKSSFCALVMVDEIMRSPHFCAIALRQVKDTLADSVYSQLAWAVDKLGFTEHFKFTKTSPMQIEKIDTGQIIYFRGCDEPMKIKSIKPPKNMHIGVVWFEEKDQLKGIEAVRNIQQSVMRGGDDIIVLSSYNTPLSSRHFPNRHATELNFEKHPPSADGTLFTKEGEVRNASKALFRKEGGTSNASDGCFRSPVTTNRIIHHSYYYDSPAEWLGQPFIDEAEYLKETNEKAYRHEYLGEATGEGGNVFENVAAKRFDSGDYKKIVDSGRFYYGVDWGFYPDPWAFVKCCYIPKDRRLYIIDEASAYKKSNHATAEILIKDKKLANEDMIICDSSEPKSITDYISCGLYARGAEKGSGSVAYSMKWLQGLNEIVIDAQKCPNAAREFLDYEYEKDSDGEIISGYPDRNNHFIDAVRYATNLLWRRG